MAGLDLYSNQDDYNPNKMSGSNCKTRMIRLENVVIEKSGCKKIYIPNSFEIIPWANLMSSYEKESMKNSEIYNLLDYVAFSRGSGRLDGDYEIGEVHHSYGELEPLKPPFSIRAEGGEIEFESRTYALAKDSAGNVRKYKNGVAAFNNINIEVSHIELSANNEIKEMRSNASKLERTALISSGVVIGSGFLIENGHLCFGWPLLFASGLTAIISSLAYGIRSLVSRKKINSLYEGELCFGFNGNLARRPLGSYY